MNSAHFITGHARLHFRFNMLVHAAWLLLGAAILIVRTSGDELQPCHCKTGDIVCGDHCCPSSHICCGLMGDRCCPSGDIACGDHSCPPSQMCCGDRCCPSGDTCCMHQPDQCCSMGHTPCGTHSCSSGETCCGDHCCPSGHMCCGISGNRCCPSTDMICGDHSCPVYETCCGDQCCPYGHTCCLDHCCPSAEPVACTSQINAVPWDTFFVAPTVVLLVSSVVGTIAVH